MPKLNELDAWLGERLPELLAEHQVPAASIAVYAHGEVIDRAAGVLNKNTGVEATADSVFQIGSITKVWTATLVMQLVDEGALDLDAPVRTYVTEFVLADEKAAAEITVRQLLCHVGGFEGDIFTDTGRGEDAVGKLVPLLADMPQLFAPGEMFSYNNAAFCVLGRLVEVLRGKPYDECLGEYLIKPLGLTHTAPSPYEAVMHRAAMGHLSSPAGDGPRPAPYWATPRSNAPAGSMLAMQSRDLLTFARMHIDGGLGPDGTRVLSAESALAMRRREVEVPDLGYIGSAWGLGWALYDWPGGAVVGHDGNTVGQSAFLRVVPEQDVAVALLTNGGDPIPLFTELAGRVLHELAGIEMPARPTPGAEAAGVQTVGAGTTAAGQPATEASRFVGTYASSVYDTVVSQDTDGRLWVERIPKGVLATTVSGPPEKIELVAYDGDTLITAEPVQGMFLPHAFIGDDGEGRALFVHTGRADRRVER
ncbi:serine hydrolase domain-containing protein [Streptomyces sp. NPDC059479]|uniref:serine hydrolase domain-containing protein n=1 Tax=Streptomyces sp. NPDC059479 TaxID=3346848 RepID=UPI0036738090